LIVFFQEKPLPNEYFSSKSMVGICFWVRKWPDLGSHEAIFELNSSAIEREKAEVRACPALAGFQKWPFAGQRAKSKHALKHKTNKK
jgi:hypothetical protein